MPILTRRQKVFSDLETVFAFFEDPLNLEIITPPWLHFEVHEATDDRVRLGTEIAYKLKWQVFPMSWRSRISEYEPRVLFADEMIHGPYQRWYHRHLFEEVPGGVLVTDVVDYKLPFGLLGWIAHRLVIREQLERIFNYRSNVIAEIFHSGAVIEPR